MQEHKQSVGPWQTVVVECSTAGQAEPRAAVVMLHGYAMKPGDLSPFAHTVGIPARFYYPQGSHAVSTGGYSFWPVDEARRAAEMAKGPRDLTNFTPPGCDRTNEEMAAFLNHVRTDNPGLPIVLGGFSQGGMLCCDFLLHSRERVAALLMLSASRIRFADWQAGRESLRDLPVLVSHGRQDEDLAFSTGQSLHAFLAGAGARTRWVPFEGKHEIPLIVWRELRKFLGALLRSL